MDQGSRRVALLCIAIALCAVIFATTVPVFVSARGIAGPVIAESERPLLALGAAIAAFAACVAVAAFIGRKLNAVVALFVLGCGVGMLAMRSGAVRDLAFGQLNLWLYAAECLLWTVLVAGACHVIFRVGGRLPDFPETHEEDIDSPTGRSARISWLAGIAGVIVASLAAVTTGKGQALGAAILGGFVAGALGRVLAPRTTPVYLAAAPMAAFTLVSVFLAFSVRGDLGVGLVEGGLPRPLWIMPIDMATGALVGTALGFGFVRSFAEPKTA